jgi:hypothetical protein
MVAALRIAATTVSARPSNRRSRKLRQGAELPLDEFTALLR